MMIKKPKKKKENRMGAFLSFSVKYKKCDSDKDIQIKTLNKYKSKSETDENEVRKHFQYFHLRQIYQSATLKERVRCTIMVKINKSAEKERRK